MYRDMGIKVLMVTPINQERLHAKDPIRGIHGVKSEVLDRFGENRDPPDGVHDCSKSVEENEETKDAPDAEVHFFRRAWRLCAVDLCC